MKGLKSVARISFDLLIFAGLCLTVVALRKWFKPFKRGFFCNDESLQYPYRETTIGTIFMVTIVLAVPSAVMIVVELFKQLFPAASDKRKSSQQNNSKGSCRIGERLMQCYIQIGYYLFGLALCLISTYTAKGTLGRLRPHFFAVCQPKLADSSTCKDSFNFGRYIEQYECVGENHTESTLAQVGESFPSAHSSIFFYSMVYLAIYLQAALSTRASKLLKHLLQFMFIMFAGYVALTRISDYYHHWSDVIAGSILGALLAFVVAIFVAKIFVRRPIRSSGNIAPKPPVKPAASPTNSSAKSNNTPPVLPAYTFGTLPYLTHPHAHAPTAAAVAAAAAAAAAAQQQAQFAQAYHNYGYVP